MITNYLSPLEFIVIVKRLPNVQFYTQRTIIPNISVAPIEYSTPFKPVYQTGDRLQYSELNFTFILNEDMSNYIEIYDWMKGTSFPENFNQYKQLEESNNGIKSDISIKILNSNKNPTIQVDYYDCFPTDLSEITLDTTQTDVVYPEATATFRYNYFTITKL
jgi:hypothetical protein